MVAAIVSLLNEYRLKEGLPRVGFVNPLLYQMAQEKPEVIAAHPSDAIQRPAISRLALTWTLSAALVVVS